MDVQWLVKSPFVLFPILVDCVGTIVSSILGLIVGNSSSSIKIIFCLPTTFCIRFTQKLVYMCLRRQFDHKENYFQSK